MSDKHREHHFHQSAMGCMRESTKSSKRPRTHWAQTSKQRFSSGLTEVSEKAERFTKGAVDERDEDEAQGSGNVLVCEPPGPPRCTGVLLYLV